ncbi:hypothetical protein [Rhizobium sp.]|uniref:hypothetical protein n=1 Tax=Rhizobium sp. TaxID=391 RepID=UPI002F0CD3A7
MLTMQAVVGLSTNLWLFGKPTGRHKKGPNQGPGQERLTFDEIGRDGMFSGAGERCPAPQACD